MLGRTAQRLETTLLLSRQSLPRPARLCPSSLRPYSSPSKPAHAPAAATAQLPPPDHAVYPPYMASPSSSSSDMLSPFLSRLEYTILPAPLPAEEHKTDPLFQTTELQDQLAVMDACLHNAFNVPRAKSIFEKLREEHPASLTTDVYNSLLMGYFKVAEAQTRVKLREEWAEEGWNLFRTMFQPDVVARPDENTYAIMLASKHSIQMTEGHESVLSEEDFIKSMIDRQLDVVTVLANPIIPDDLAESLFTAIASAALALRRTDIVNALAKAKAVASGQSDVPEAVAAIKPVIPKPTKSSSSSSSSTTTMEKEEGEVPFNIQNLRDHLAHIAYAKSVLPADNVARQRHLELSAYDMAESRLKAEASNMSSLGIDNRFQDKLIQSYMHNWHTNLTTRIGEEVKRINEEEIKGRYRLKNKSELTPYLALVRPDRLSMITILEVMQLTGTGGIVSGMKTTRALIQIGRAVELEYKARVSKSHKLPIPDLTTTTSTSPNNARAEDLFSEGGVSLVQIYHILFTSTIWYHMWCLSGWSVSRPDLETGPRLGACEQPV